MIAISKEVEFDAGHRVPGHASKCRNPHGHRYRVEVTCRGWIVEEPGAPDEGMLVDFGDLKTLMTERVHDVLDHGFIVYEGDSLMRRVLDPRDPYTNCGPEWKVITFPYVPTAENIARWIWDELSGPITQRFRDGLVLHRVKVWETPTSVAVVEADPHAQLLRDLGGELRFPAERNSWNFYLGDQVITPDEIRRLEDGTP